MNMKHKLGIVAAILAGAFAIAGPIKVWGPGEYITAADLNANMQHLHQNLGHAHGAVIVNSDINGSAAISHSKLATPGLVAKAWFTVPSVCTIGTCTQSEASGTAATVTWMSTGHYNVDFTPVFANANYAVFISARAAFALCLPSSAIAGNFDIICTGDDFTTFKNSGFSVLVMDANN